MVAMIDPVARINRVLDPLPSLPLVQCLEVSFHATITTEFYLCHVAGLLLRKAHLQRQESSSSATWPAIFIGQDLPACMTLYRLLSCYHELASHIQQQLITAAGMRMF